MNTQHKQRATSTQCKQQAGSPGSRVGTVLKTRRNEGTEYCLLHGTGETLTAATRVSRSAESAAMLDTIMRSSLYFVPCIFTIPELL